MAHNADANTARFDKWGRPSWPAADNDRSDDHQGGWHPRWHPGNILVVVAGFIIWWPLGLAALAYTIWSRKMGCMTSRHGRWADRMEKMQWKMDRMRSRMEGRYYAPSSGNRAFDEYRSETLQRLENEQTEFRDFLERLRHAKDKEEFDSFMSQQRPRSTPPEAQAGN